MSSPSAQSGTPSLRRARASVRRRLRGVTAMLVVLCLAGCTSMPVSGPQSWDITAVSNDGEIAPSALVKLTSAAVTTLKASAPRLAGYFPDSRRPDGVRFGIGDVVGVTLFEAGSGGLFFPNDPGTIHNRGNISVPYAGTIAAAGRSPTEVQKSIVEALRQRALEPQAIVTLIDQRATSISVLGDVRSAGRYAVIPNGERLLESIARAGGPSGAGFETWVVLERDGRRAAAPFGALVDEPANNIFVRDRDIIYLFRQPETFLAFGASGRQGQFNFDAWRVTLAEAVAKASGLNDNAADAGSVFLYRGETRQVAEKLGVDVKGFEGPIIPIIYQLDLRDPAGFFLAGSFEMRNRDVIYVSNAASVETSKFLSFIRLIIATANDPIIAANGGYALKSAINGGTTSTTIVQSTQTLR